MKLSNLAKVLWPRDGLTKGDLIAYYKQLAPLLLPWTRGRAVTLTRYPDGIDGKSFFQKNAPDHTPEWVRVAIADQERGEGHIEAIVIDDVDTLLYVANLAAIPLHLPAARVDEPDRPTWTVVDLDPKTAPFEHVVQCALALRELCEQIGLPSYPKTSGQKGLHVLVPLGGQCTQAESKALAELLARVVEARLPKISTTARMIDQRGGRVYLDFGQNGRGKTIAGTWAVRPVDGATCSAPLRWDEVDGRLDPRAFTLRTLPARAERLGDLCAPVLTQRPDLAGALARLSKLVSR